jgi:hypothetical protein
MPKKKVFRLEEKNARLDIRIREPLREKLENYCIENHLRLTDAVTKAIEMLLGSDKNKAQKG